MGVSEVDCSQNSMARVNTTLPDSYGYVVDCGIVDHPPADCSRMTATAVAHQAVFEIHLLMNGQNVNWNPKHIQQYHDQVIKLCDFPTDSIMVKYIEQQQ
jgi:hypothetical protein